MKRQEAVQYLIKDSDWLKKVWVRKLNISYNQLARWLSPKPVNIRVNNVEAIAKVCGYEVKWLDENQQELELIKPDLGPSNRGHVYDDPLTSTSIEFTMPMRIRYLNVYTMDQVKKIYSGPDNELSALPTADQLACPIEIGDDYAYAVLILDNYMKPALTPQMRIVVHPKKRYSAGDLVIMRDPKEKWYIGELQSSKDNYSLIRYNSSDVNISKDKSVLIHKIAWIRLPQHSD